MTTRETVLAFADFRLDPRNFSLCRGRQALKLKPKAFDVLHYLVDHAGQLVSKDELWRAVWPDVAVTEGVLTVCVTEIRQVLGDGPKAPRFIETVHGRGYRFIAPVTAGAAPVSSSKFQVPSSDTQDSALRTLHSALVGREAELAQLHSRLDKALSGERQMVFITGEPGIGKSALTEAFVSGIREQGTGNSAPASTDPHCPTPNLWIAHGQCIELFGAGEPYLPVLEAVGALCREPDGQQIVTVLNQYAPTWLLQLPAVLGNLDLDLLQRKTAGATRERMLRELAEALEILTTDRPLVLVLEDLHWSDFSTLELLSYLARRRHSCRLLVIGTYRPVEMLADGHPLKRVTQELFAHSLGQELTLKGLSAAEVTTYLTRRFPESVLPLRLGQVLSQRTGGNPLFLTSLVQDLLSRQVILQEEDGKWAWHGELAELERWTPESVRHVLARQREQLAPEEQRVLAAASLAGLEFSAATVAAALEIEATQVEGHCGRLAEQQHFLRLAGLSDWPDGTRAARYGFLHA